MSVGTFYIIFTLFRYISSSAGKELLTSCPDLLRQFDNVTHIYADETAVEGNELAFLHIPKNAGATIESRFGSRGTHFKNASLYNTTYPYSKCSVWHIPPRYWTPTNPYADHHKDVFCVARHPVDKVLSQFKMSKNMNKLTKYHATGTEILAAAEKWFGSDFSDVLTSSAHDCHMVPQYKYVWDFLGRRTCRRVIRFEDGIDESYNSLLSKYHISDTKKYFNSSTPGENKLHHEPLNFTLTYLNLSLTAIEKIEQMYWMDMCLFGYNTSMSGLIV
jgi:hypothetical protein